MSEAMSNHPARKPDGRLPKSYRLKEELMALLPHLPTGLPLPAERVLAERYGVSRGTVRHALQDLMFEGRLFRMQGRGTFVARAKLTQTLRLTSHTREMEVSGLVPGSVVLSTKIGDATGAIAAMLELIEGDRICTVQRLRLANEEPMALESLYVAADRFPDLGERIAGGASFYRLLEEVYFVRLARGQETIECVLASPEAADLLSIEPSSPMLKLTRRTWDVNDRVIEFVESLYRGDRYRFVAPLEIPGLGRQE